jgi:hypothetical protein
MLILACALMVALAGVYVLMPLFREPKGNLEAELLAETELDRLLARKATVYSNLKELEFEYKMGRLGDADFKRLEAGYRAEAAVVLQKLDELGVAEELDEKIEKEVAVRKSRLHAAGEGVTCPACGVSLIPGKKFCADCGHKLS